MNAHQNGIQGDTWRQSADAGNARGSAWEPVSDSATEIRRVWAKGGAYTFELAKVVYVAKTRLRRLRGHWTGLWRRPRQVPFSKRTADMLAVIGEQMAWANWQTFANLPRGWSVIYCLSRLDRADLERLIGEGVVHPGLKLREAKALVSQLLGKRVDSEPKRPDAIAWIEKLVSFIDSTLDEWSLRQRQLAGSKLREVLLQIDKAAGAGQATIDSVSVALGEQPSRLLVRASRPSWSEEASPLLAGATLAPAMAKGVSQTLVFDFESIPQNPGIPAARPDDPVVNPKPLSPLTSQA